MEAHRIARDLGAAPLQREVERLAARSRLDIASPPVGIRRGCRRAHPVEPTAIPFRLTRREQDVLERLTLGRTNREIATDLFISEKTASVHVSNIKSKLGANGRAEIAAIAVRLGLVSDRPTETRETAVSTPTDLTRRPITCCRFAMRTTISWSEPNLGGAAQRGVRHRASGPRPASPARPRAAPHGRRAGPPPCVNGYHRSSSMACSRLTMLDRRRDVVPGAAASNGSAK